MKKVLVVEDDQYIREAITIILELENFDVQCASNGEEALQVLRKDTTNLPHLILLDLMMPVKDGSEFLKEQSQDLMIANIPIVLLSAASNIQLKDKSLGAKLYLKKPIDIDTLLQVVTEMTA